MAARAAALVNRVRDVGFQLDDEFRDEYAAVYVAWADLAEGEVMGATMNDEPVKKEGLRGRPPVLVWRSIQSERRPEV